MAVFERLAKPNPSGWSPRIGQDQSVFLLRMLFIFTLASLPFYLSLPVLSDEAPQHEFGHALAAFLLSGDAKHQVFISQSICEFIITELCVRQRIRFIENTGFLRFNTHYWNCDPPVLEFDHIFRNTPTGASCQKMESFSAWQHYIISQSGTLFSLTLVGLGAILSRRMPVGCFSMYVYSVFFHACMRETGYLLEAPENSDHQNRLASLPTLGYSIAIAGLSVASMLIFLTRDLNLHPSFFKHGVPISNRDWDLFQSQFVGIKQEHTIPKMCAHLADLYQRIKPNSVDINRLVPLLRHISNSEPDSHSEVEKRIIKIVSDKFRFLSPPIAPELFRPSDLLVKLLRAIRWSRDTRLNSLHTFVESNFDREKFKALLHEIMGLVTDKKIPAISMGTLADSLFQLCGSKLLGILGGEYLENEEKIDLIQALFSEPEIVSHIEQYAEKPERQTGSKSVSSSKQVLTNYAYDHRFGLMFMAAQLFFVLASIWSVIAFDRNGYQYSS